ncbi:MULTISPECIES: restriction endonuclease subunit S [Enterobacteriaceae]|uniref:Restriction endonuclease subunit S n=1 Tax=Citrobacter braakii TaxID=57706 RepID=A0ABR6TS41_CITBR|nr:MULTISPECIES: restriction endonuclease subunit S [Enterobacteriaceae]MED6346603.1 restriction endonuclease subunit S [Escherichia coli O157]EEY5394875.1 restriction endonuclease subunit S [Escherichia coli]EFH5935878.1 restriction endonuclease subunit S [Escherichia coli]EFO2918892.1 restriction endonuclease subunit S [Escherichia coli]EGO4584101.1 restriction endonuclease subunit S [Escherichia coli]
MAKYKMYPEYKDSGVEWLGEIPNHWKTVSISRLFSRIKRTGYTEKELLSVYRDYGVIPKSSRDDNNNKPSEDLSPYQLVEPNDLVMNKMKAWQGSIAISEYEGIVSPAYFVYKPNNVLFELAHPRYVHYLLRNPIYVTQYLSRSKGIRVNQWDLDPDEFRNIELLLPDKTEQEKIYSFLDHETAKIDNLIEKQQQLIELLKEKRQAVISSVASIRSNERKTKLKNLVSIQTGYPFSSTKFKFSPDNSIPLLRGVNVGVDSIKWDDVVYWDVRTLDRLSDYLLAAGDIVFGMDRPWISSGARVSEIKEQDLPCLLLQRVARIRSNIKSYQPFIKLCLSSNEFREYAEIDLTGVSVPHISPEQISNFYVRDIPFDDQVYLAKKVLEKIDKIQITQEMVEQTIQILQERRTALISAAVTGKIDVRDWVAPDTQDAEEPQEATA